MITHKDITIQKVLEKDVTKLLGLDIYRASEELNYYLKGEGQIFRHDAIRKAEWQIFNNLRDIVEEYLTWRPTKFKDPMDQYYWIYDSRIEIMEILMRNKEQEPIRDPHFYWMAGMLKRLFDRLFDNLITTGKTHKFQDEVLQNSMDETLEPYEDPR